MRADRLPLGSWTHRQKRHIVHTIYVENANMTSQTVHAYSLCDNIVQFIIMHNKMSQRAIKVLSKMLYAFIMAGDHHTYHPTVFVTSSSQLIML